jgi:hypothetical protein
MSDAKVSKHIFFSAKKKIVMDSNFHPTVRCLSGNCGEHVVLKRNDNNFLFVGQCPNCSCFHSTPPENVG